MFFSKKKKINEIDMSRLPQHIGIIMDGNGRWAKKRGLPRSAGHSAGADSLKKIITEANNLGVKYNGTLNVVKFYTQELWEAKDKEGWTATCESVQESEGPVSSLIDGNINTFWACSWNPATPECRT